MEKFTVTSEEQEIIYYKATDVLMKICTPVFILFGTIGNVLSAVIWYRLLKTTAAAVFLVAISVSNSIGLLQEPLARCIYHWFSIDLRQNGSVCKTFFVLNNISYCCSVWFVFAFVLERTTRLLHIHTGNNGTKRSLVYVILISLASFTLAIVVIFSINTDIIKGKNVSIFQLSSSLVCGVQTNEFFISSTHFNFFWLQSLICSLFPFTFITGCLIATVQMLYLHKRGNMATFLTVEVPVTSGDIELARTVLFLGLTTIICSAPQAIFKTQVDVIQRGADELTYSIIAVLIYVDYTYKFLVYCLFNPRFRQALAVLFRTGTLLRRLSGHRLRTRRPDPLSLDTTVELIGIHIESQDSSPEAEKETSCEQLSSKSSTGVEIFKFDIMGETNQTNCLEEVGKLNADDTVFEDY